MQVDQDVRERFLKFDQPRCEPEGAEALGDCDLDLAGGRIGGRNAGAHQIEGSGFHPFDGRDHGGTFFRQTGAVNVAREQGSARLSLEIIDAAAHGVDRQRKPLGRGAKAAPTRDFQKNSGRVPVRQPAGSRIAAFLLRNAPFCRQMHTNPFWLLNLAEYRSNYNHGGSRHGDY